MFQFAFHCPVPSNIYNTSITFNAPVVLDLLHHMWTKCRYGIFRHEPVLFYVVSANQYLAEHVYSTTQTLDILFP